jgi:Domain of unknown function (DUF4386)
LFLITLVSSIPALLVYDPVLNEIDYVVSAGADNRVFLRAFLEVLLIIANVGTAVVLFAPLRRVNQPLAVGYVTARLVECAFIAVGILSMRAVGDLAGGCRRRAGAAAAGSLGVAGRSLVAIHDWSFLLGPGFVVGIGNGMILGCLMYAPGLVPRRMALLSYRRPAAVRLRSRCPIRRLRSRIHRAGPRHAPGVPLGAVPRHLRHRQGLQGISGRW